MVCFHLLLKAYSILHLLMLTERLFHRVAAVFPKHLLPYVKPPVCDIVSSAPDSDVRDLVR